MLICVRLCERVGQRMGLGVVGAGRCAGPDSQGTAGTPNNISCPFHSRVEDGTSNVGNAQAPQLLGAIQSVVVLLRCTTMQ